MIKPKPLNILVIDDDEIDRMAVRRSLHKTGIPLMIAEDSFGKSGINRLKNAPKEYDCVFLDYRLPDLDGLALIKQLRQSGIGIPLRQGAACSRDHRHPCRYRREYDSSNQTCLGPADQ